MDLNEDCEDRSSDSGSDNSVKLVQHSSFHHLIERGGSSATENETRTNHNTDCCSSSSGKNVSDSFNQERVELSRRRIYGNSSIAKVYNDDIMENIESFESSPPQQSCTNDYSPKSLVSLNSDSDSETPFEAPMHPDFSRQDDIEDDEQAMIEAAIHQSLKEVPKSASCTQSSSLNSTDSIQLENLDSSFDMSKAYPQGTDVDSLIDLQMEQLVDNYSEDIVAETLSVFGKIKESYETNNSTGDDTVVPSVQEALEVALRNKTRRDQIQQQESTADAEFIALKDDFSEETLAEARSIFDELSSMQRENGGRTPTIEYALSIAQDRMAGRAKAIAVEEGDDEPRKVTNVRDSNIKEAESSDMKPWQSKLETREERAARFAAIAEKRKHEKAFVSNGSGDSE